MKSSLFFVTLLFTHFLHPLHEPNPTEEDIEDQRKIAAIFFRARAAGYDARKKRDFKRYLRKYPATVNTVFTSVPFFMDLAYRQLWTTFELLLNEHESDFSHYALNVSLTDKDRNNLIHVLIQTKAPSPLLIRTCSLFPHLLHEFNYEKRQHYIKDEEDESGIIITEHHTHTPLEFLILTKKDEWEKAQALLDYGAAITPTCIFIINKGKHPHTKRVFQQHRDKLAQVESLPVPIPLPADRRQLPAPPPLRRSGGRTQLQPSSSYRPPPEYHSLGFNSDEGSE